MNSIGSVGERQLPRDINARAGKHARDVGYSLREKTADSHAHARFAPAPLYPRKHEARRANVGQLAQSTRAFFLRRHLVNLDLDVK